MNIQNKAHSNTVVKVSKLLVFTRSHHWNSKTKTCKHQNKNNKTL